ncbi:MAG TPA: PIG-L family deacetylase [Acidobacteriota bacterium]|nr:PIG-L family deacetylase [Acidobacteriota bacterium]
MKHFSVPLVGAALLATALANSSLVDTERGGVGLALTLKRLQTTATVLHIAAHPDDEDGPLLTLLARRDGVRTVLFTMNRGEGGANAISSEVGERLGLLRTLELVQAARFYAAEPRFNRLIDYGFSKRVEEALQKWGGEEAFLRDLVRVIRQERPQVIVARFRDHPEDGGGHATAHLVGLAARRAFRLAADDEIFPDQIEQGLRPWQAQKLYLHSRRPDSPFAVDRWHVRVDAGEHDPLLGRSYFEIARLGLNHERTQNMAQRAPRSGSFPIYYERIDSALDLPDGPEEGFFQAIDTTLPGLAASLDGEAPDWLSSGLRRLAAVIEESARTFQPRRPQALVARLAEGLKTTRELLDRISREMPRQDAEIHFRLVHKERQLETALRQALGLDWEWKVMSGRRQPERGPFQAFPTFLQAVAGQEFKVAFRLANPSSQRVAVNSVGLDLPSGWTSELLGQPPGDVGPGQVVTAEFRVRVAQDAAPTRPYWLRGSPDENVYTLRRQEWAGRPLPPYPAHGFVSLDVAGAEFEGRDAVRVTQYDPRQGPAYPPLTVVPRLSVGFAGSSSVLPRGTRRHSLTARIRSASQDPLSGRLRLTMPAGWTSRPAEAAFALDRPGEEKELVFQLEIPGAALEGDYAVSAQAASDGRLFREEFTTVTAPGLGRFNYFQPARHTLKLIQLKLPEKLRVGYVEGTGDSVADVLTRLGVKVEMFDSQALAAGDLSALDAIVLGVRAYAVRPDLIAHNSRLLDYVAQGGTLLVQYQTPEFDRNFGPYPYRMTSSPQEVSEESAPVRILQPSHPVFRTPNPITPADFEGWVQERGSKFLTSWDEAYAPLLESHDHGQPPQRGGLLIARYGRGHYIYCAYAFYRQMPEGVPGAVRLFINLLALGSESR